MLNSLSVYGRARTSSLTTSVAVLPVRAQYFSSILASSDAKTRLICLTANFLLMFHQLSRIINVYVSIF